MRNTVELGIGREVRTAYRLDDVAIVPSRRTRSSKDVDTTWNIDAYTFDIPFISHPSDALASPEFVIEMGRQGGLGVLNAEGLWARHEDMSAIIDQIVGVISNGEDAAYYYDDAKAIKRLQTLYAAPINEELLTARIGQVRDSGATVAVRVSPQHARSLAPLVIKAGTELLIIQGTIISAEHVTQGSEQPLNLKEFIGSLDVPIIVGGVSDYTTALHLMRTGAAGVIIGGGTNTNDVALGIESPMATAIADAAAARRDYLDETGGRYVHIIADGELNNSGDVAKAIACGADAVMLGAPLAIAEEAAAAGFYWPPVAGHPRFPRGIVMPRVYGQNEEEDSYPSLETVLHGPSTDPFGALNFVGGLRRAMAKCGFTDLKKFQKVQFTTRGANFYRY